MKKSGYMTRALKARDPRYARILGKLGYERGDVAAEDAPAKPDAPEPIDEVRAEYERILGKRPFNGWDIETLREKIAKAGE